MVDTHTNCHLDYSKGGRRFEERKKEKGREKEGERTRERKKENQRERMKKDFLMDPLF